MITAQNPRAGGPAWPCVTSLGSMPPGATEGQLARLGDVDCVRQSVTLPVRSGDLIMAGAVVLRSLDD